jgi:hypothetical protein
MRNLSLTAAILGGLTLLAFAVGGIAAIDGRLEAETPKQQLRNTFDVSYPAPPPHACRHRDAVERRDAFERRLEDWRRS